MGARQYLLIAFLLILTAYTYALRFRDVPPSGAVTLADVPIAIPSYAGREEVVDSRTLEVLGADQTIFREYRKSSGRPIWLFLAYFDVPKENSQIHSPKHCYPGAGWNITGESAMEIEFGERRLNAKSLSITDGEHEQFVLYWFHTGSGIITNEYALKLDQMKNALLRKSQRSTFIRFSTLIEEGEDMRAVQLELTEFISSIAPHLLATLNGQMPDRSPLG